MPTEVLALLILVGALVVAVAVMVVIKKLMDRRAEQGAGASPGAGPAKAEEPSADDEEDLDAGIALEDEGEAFEDDEPSFSMDEDMGDEEFSLSVDGDEDVDDEPVMHFDMGDEMDDEVADDFGAPMDDMMFDDMPSGSPSLPSGSPGGSELGETGGLEEESGSGGVSFDEDVSLVGEERPEGRMREDNLSVFLDDREAALSGSESQRGVFGEEEAVRDEVDCTVFGPSEAVVDDAVLIQVFAHMPSQAAEAQAAAQEFDEDAQRRGFTSLGTEIERGSKLTFELIMKGLEVEDPVQELVWQGRPDSVEFEVDIPADAKRRNVIGKVIISQETVPIGTIRFKLKIVGEKSGEATSKPMGQSTRYQKAFISYASKDRPEVLRRVQMLRAVGIDCFQDVLNLDPGDRWERKLYHHIDESDVMFLFWSTAAKQSEWVAREWEYGLKREEEDFICPVIIEGPPPVPPPSELEHIHFSDKVLYFLASS